MPVGQDTKKDLGEGPTHRAGRMHLVLGGEPAHSGQGSGVGGGKQALNKQPNLICNDSEPASSLFPRPPAGDLVGFTSFEVLRCYFNTFLYTAGFETDLTRF